MGNTSIKPHPRTRQKKQVHWKAADRPSPPGKPQLVSESEITPDVVTIRWDPPRYDGGSPITGYLVEHRRYGSPHWVRATPLLVPFTELSLSGLEPGWRYQFRISAENAVGLSLPGELSDLLTVTLQRSAIAAPRFVDELTDTVALENDKIEFSVQFIGQPAPKISWFKDGFEIFSSRRIRIITENDKSVLTIHQAALEDEGEIKCTATNRAGHASTKSNLTLEASPSIRLPRQYEDGLLFELGEVMRLKVSIAGRPTPLVFWSHNNESIKSDDRYEIENTEKYSSIRLEEVQRTDRGEYQVKAVNKLGEAVSSFLVTVTDKPSPPGKARVVMSLGRSVTLSWTLPTDDGGCKIGNYIVEYFRIGWDVWLKAATCRQLTTTIGDLIEGSEYKFRVKAESPYGVSDPSCETDVVFIPDPKRGILTASIRSKSQPRDIITTDLIPTPTKRQPRSLSSTRGENITERITNAVHFYDGGVPVRPVRTKLKSPSITPEPSPRNNRRNVNVEVLDKNMFDRLSVARDLAYGTPEMKVRQNEIEYESVKLNASRNNVIKSTINVIHNQNTNAASINQDAPESDVLENKTQLRRKSPSPSNNRSSSALHQARPSSHLPEPRRSPSPLNEMTIIHPSIEKSGRQSDSEIPSNRNNTINRALSPLRFIDKKRRSSSPVEEIRHEAVNPRFHFSSTNPNDQLSNSSEFMLVLLPENQRGRGSASNIIFDFDESSVPPPMSLSAPELGAEPLLPEPMRSAVSSTELLHEKAMQRFYQALEAEDTELDNKKTVNSVELPKIQINSKDNQTIVGLERKDSLRRRLSAGGLNVPQQILWAQRRHSLRNSPDLSELPENNLRKHPELLNNKIVEDQNKSNPIIEVESLVDPLKSKRESFATRQRSESEEKEEEEFEKVRAKMALKKKEPRKAVKIVKEEEWDATVRDYEKSVTESESESSEDERVHDELPPQIKHIEEEIYHPPMNLKAVSQPKSIKNEPFEILTKPNPLPDPNFKPKPILKRSAFDEDNIVRKVVKQKNNTSVLQERPLSNNSKALSNFKEASRLEANPRKPPIGPFAQNTQPKSKKSKMKKRALSPVAQNRNMPFLGGNTRPGLSQTLPISTTEQPRAPKRTNEEIRVMVDHYGDILKSYGQKKKSLSEVYLNADELKAAAERQSEEELREMKKTILDDEKEESDELQTPVDSEGRRRSFVFEASSALFRTVKDKVAAAFADDPVEDDIIPPDEEIIPSRERRGSAQILKKRLSRSTSKIEAPKSTKRGGGGPASAESNWSNLRAPSPTRQMRKASPTQIRRTSLIPPTTQTRRTSLGTINPQVKPKMRETTTQTSSMLDARSGILYAARQEELTAKVEYKVRTTVDYITDLVMFIVACWLYLFQNELLAIPVLLIMVYRQLKEEIKKKLPSWMGGKKKAKRK